MVTLDFRNLCTYSDFGRCSTAHRIIDANRQRVVASNRSRLRASHDLTGGGTIDRFHLLVSFCLPLVSISMRCSNVKRTPVASEPSTGSMLSRGPPLLLPAVCQTSFTKR